MSGNTAESQDLLQEVFMKFYLATKEQMVFSNPGAFILTIARNLFLNKRRDTTPTVPIEDFIIHVDEGSSVVERDELLHLITLSLDLLEVEYREAFVLKYYQGYSYEEMASITGETIPALKNRVWRAKEQIRRTLKPYIMEIQK